MSGTITIQTHHGPAEVLTYGAKGGLVITSWLAPFRDDGRRNVTHAASGFCVTPEGLSQPEVERWMTALLATGIDWGRSLESLREDPEVRRVVHEAWSRRPFCGVPL